MKLKLILTCLLVGLSAFAEENPCNVEGYYEIESMRVEEIELPADYSNDLIENSSNRDIVGEVVEVTDALIALGKKVWTLVEKGRPVLNIGMVPAVSVLPNSKADPSSTFYSMENWAAPRSKAYRVVYTNLLGMNVVTFEYAVVYQYGGELNGKGKYLTAVDIVPRKVNVIFGYSFDASSRLVSITNVAVSYTHLTLPTKA